MSYNLLFFSVNRHQETYFKQLLAVVREGDRAVLLHTRALRWLLPYFSINNTDILLVKEVSDMRMTYFYNKTGKKEQVFGQILRRIFYHSSTFLFLLKVRRLLKTDHFDLIVLWNDMKWHQYIVKSLAFNIGIKTAFFENGALPNTVTVDPKGVNFNNSVPRDSQFYLDYMNHSHIEQLTSSNAVDMNGDNSYIFVPFQVDYDTQIISHSPWICDMESLYSMVEKILPLLPKDLDFIIKEHPKSSRSYDHLHGRNPRISFRNSEDTQSLVLKSQAVVTINSTVGLESILKDKQVIVLGNAFYAIDGLCQTAVCEEELVENIHNSVPLNKDIKNSFVSYLHTYYISGDWHHPSLEHLKNIEERIYEQLEQL
jgi:capsular polysaccharide export protein